MHSWTDPENISEDLYADQSSTNVKRAPTNQTSGWIFRGWRVVRANGYLDQAELYTNWEPIQYDSQHNVIYYQPGDEFTIDSTLVS